MNLADYRPTPYAITHVEMTFVLDPLATRVKARISLALRQGTPAGTPLVLDAENLTLVNVSLNGQPLGAEAYTLSDEHFTLPCPPSGAFVLEVVSEIAPAKNTELSGLYQSGGMYTTQCEAVGFRRIIPFLDRPDVLATYRVRIEAPAHLPVLLSNGNPLEAGKLQDGWHYAVWEDPHPKPSYLFALVAGDLDVASSPFTTAEGRPVQLNVYVVKGQGSRASFALEALKASMRFDEEVYKRCYDLDVFNIVAVPDFNMGAMENKGLNIFNDKYILAEPDTATDVDFMNVDSIVAHEYFHNWTGNRITCRDWFQLCLKEGLTVYREQTYMAQRRGEAVARMGDIRKLRASQFAEDAGPLAHPVRPSKVAAIDNLYTATVYDKGAELVRVLKAMIGDAAFDAGLQAYFVRHDGQAVTIEDFLQCFADTGAPEALSMLVWYNQAGTPQLDVMLDHDAANHQVRLHLRQSYSEARQAESPLPVPLPLRFGLIDPEGKTSTLEQQVMLREATQTVTLPWAGQTPVLSLNQGFLVPLVVRAKEALVDPLVLMRRDTDPVNRWLACQDVFMKAMAHHYTHGVLAHEDMIKQGLEEILSDQTLNDGLKAEFLMPPSETEFSRIVGENVFPEKVFAARQALRLGLSCGLTSALWRLYSSAYAHGNSEPVGDVSHVQARQLAHTALDLLVLGGTEEAIKTAKLHYANAHNLTTRLAALTSLYRAAPLATEELALFEARYAHEALVMDKWFACQASQPDTATLERCRTLMQHPAFTLTNPNRYRSVVAVFAQANMVAFHRPDGEGYRFTLDNIKQIDAINPQVAARLMTAFNNWRSLEPTRRALAQAHLVDFSKQSHLSKDTSDILQRLVG